MEIRYFTDLVLLDIFGYDESYEKNNNLDHNCIWFGLSNSKKPKDVLFRKLERSNVWVFC